MSSEKLEQNLLEMVKEKEKSDRRLLSIEIIMGVVSVAVMFILCLFAAYAPMADWIRIVLIVIGVAPILILTPFMLRIEQMAGYYECNHCGNKYVPSYKAVTMAPHMGRTRYMRCPKCQKKSWQKKVVSKD